MQINKKYRNIDLQKTKHLVLLGKINLKDIPFEVRIKNKSLYIYSFRYARAFTNSKKYINSIKILYKDVLTLKKKGSKTYLKPLTNLLVNYIEINPYKGDKKIEHFKKIFSKEVL